MTGLGRGVEAGLAGMPLEPAVAVAVEAGQQQGLVVGKHHTSCTDRVAGMMAVRPGLNTDSTLTVWADHTLTAREAGHKLAVQGDRQEAGRMTGAGDTVVPTTPGTGMWSCLPGSMAGVDTG